MAIPITIPRLGWNMDEGVFVAWLKPDGAVIRAGEPLFTLESDKATESVECLDDGILRMHPDGPQPGDTVPVGAVIGHVVQPGEGSIEGEPAPQLGAVTPVTAAETARAKQHTPPRNSTASHRPRSSPRARRVARELGIDWMTLQGSGRTGRIRERDVRAAAAASAVPSQLPVTPIRRTIAERLRTSHHTTAPVTLATTADATNLVNLRNQFKTATTAGSDVVPSYTDILMKLAALALQKHPLLNARWDDDQIRLSPEIHIGFAVDTEAGLLAPVLRNVMSLPLKEIAVRSRDLVERAHQRNLSADEMHGGTFTITNLGAFGVDAFTPIIHPLQCAILGVGRIQRRPVTIGDEIVIRDQITLSLTFDHRIVDGAPAARFLQTIVALLENPVPALVS
jgi:pyruvate dehydrogenase E2 component (dihydrolipoamide acetyltransferase)